MVFKWEEQTFDWFINASGYTGYDKGMANLLLPYLDGCKTLCDIGCGMAFADFEMAPYFDEITCVDISQNVIENVNKRIAEQNITNIKTICSDGLLLPDDSKWDAVISLFHGDVDLVGLRYLSYARKKIIFVVHNNEYGTTGPKKYRLRKCWDVNHTVEWLESEGLSYTFKKEELEFGQPHRNKEEAYSYFKAFTKDAPEDEMKEYVDSILVETGREDFPYYTQKTRHFGIFALDADKTRSK